MNALTQDITSRFFVFAEIYDQRVYDWLMHFGTHLLFGGVLGHHVAEVLFLHLLLSDVLLVLLRHGHGVELQLLRCQSHLHPLRVSAQPRDSAHLTARHRLHEPHDQRGSM